MKIDLIEFAQASFAASVLSRKPIHVRETYHSACRISFVSSVEIFIETFILTDNTFLYTLIYGNSPYI